ncbi:hypothetical protein KQX54_011151 [Cotesia glomerata]|uniref:Uncharacterized protein n=2 Tax=Cotesia glomerata TaxID=32391 RepID=A0AAV7ICM8_COTGL|nr:hypothetical protein KQX54_011151 [Cotesia glomerata]
MPLMRDRSIEDIIEESFAEDATTNNTESFSRKDKTISESLPTNRQDIVDFNGVANFLEGVVQKEFKKMRQSLELSMTDKFKQLLKTIQYSAEPPAKQKAWQDLGNTLPFDSLEKFLAFEESLTKDKQKKNSLIYVFQMITAGSTDCENDVNQIM